MCRKIDENGVALARKTIKKPLAFMRFFENQPFQKRTLKTMPKDHQNHPQIGPQFQKCLKKSGPKKGSKTGAPKSYFLAPKMPLGAAFEKKTSIYKPVQQERESAIII